jgi:protein-S-isoprenylcysteine O-methyltransferase Ste14
MTHMIGTAMAVAAFVLYIVSLALTFGVRILVQIRRTGSTGVIGIDRDAPLIGRLAGVLFAVSLVAGGAAPLLTLLGVLEPIAALDGTAAHVIGIVLAVGGIILTFMAQLAMGDAWRIGVDQEERTDLVTDGPFNLVRNPIYSAMIPTVFGLVLMVPNALALAVIIALVIALELQVRLVEEPYLVEVHGEAYESYAARVGRFVPGVGLLSAPG